MQGNVAESKKIIGTLSSGGSMVGGMGTVFGKDGVDGKSAYQIALDNGFEGTEKEWLDSLVGADGTIGKDGADGLTPFINANGYWQIGETNTGIKAAGIDGAKGDKGDKGDTGNSGLYIGTGEMPEDYDAQLDPDGEALSVETIIAAVCELTKPYIDEQLGVIENGSY